MTRHAALIAWGTLLLTGCPPQGAQAPPTAPIVPPIGWEEPLGTPAVRLAKNPNRDVDVNGDGYADLVVSDARLTGRRFLTVIPGGPGGLDFSKRTQSEAFTQLPSFHRVSFIGDVNGDGFSDIAVGMRTADSETTLGVLYGGAAGLSERAAVFLTQRSTTNSAPSGAYGRAAGDLNGDGLADVVVDRPGYQASIHYGKRTGLLAAPDLVIPPSASSYVTCLPVGDLDQDGFSDLLVVTRTYSLTSDESRSTVSLHRGSATGVNPVGEVQPTRTVFDLDVDERAFLAADVDNDGISDLVTKWQVTQAPGPDPREKATWWRGATIGYFRTMRPLKRWTANAPNSKQSGSPVNDDDTFNMSQHAAADVNGDGVTDLVSYDSLIVTGSKPGEQTAQLRLQTFHGGTARAAESASYPSAQVVSDVVSRISTYLTAPGRYAQGRLTCPGDIDGDGFQDCVLLEEERVLPLRGSPTGLRPVRPTEELLNASVTAATRVTHVDALSR